MCELNPSLMAGQVRARYRYRNFAEFIESYKWIVAHLRRPSDYALIARRLLDKLAAQNVRYAEITISAGVILSRNQDFAPIYDALCEEAARSPVKVRWILDAIRQLGPEHAMKVAKLAAARAGSGVVAFGIGGDERRGPVEWFAGVFDFAREAGLNLTIHAGETAGPASVWGAVRSARNASGTESTRRKIPSCWRTCAKRTFPWKSAFPVTWRPARCGGSKTTRCAGFTRRACL